MLEDNYWVIVDVSDIDDGIIDDVIQTSVDTARKSLDSSKAVLRYIGKKPRSLYGKTKYTHSQILDILSGEEWNDGEL